MRSQTSERQKEELVFSYPSALGGMLGRGLLETRNPHSTNEVRASQISFIAGGGMSAKLPAPGSKHHKCMANTAASTNIFDEIREWRTSRANSLSNQEVTKLARLRNPKTNADEAMMFTTAVLFVATAFCFYCGYLCYRDTFSGFTPFEAALSALALAGACELCKVFLTRLALRAILFGWISRTWWDFGQWGFVLVLACGAFWWSIQISTEGLEMFYRHHSETAVERTTLSDHLRAATADIDGQIASQQATQNSSLQSKWKGTVVWEAQKTATGAGKNIAALQAQRAALLTAATEEWKAADGRTTKKVEGWVFWVKKYGGYMEVVSILCLLAFAFGERKLVSHNLSEPTDWPTGTGPKPLSGERAPSSASVSQFSPTPPTVSQPSQSVSQFGSGATVVGSDEILESAKTSLMRDMANLRNGNGQPLTVARRLVAVLNNVYSATLYPHFAPTPEKMEAMSTYIETEVLPLLKEKQVSFWFESQLLQQIAWRRAHPEPLKQAA